VAIFKKGKFSSKFSFYSYGHFVTDVFYYCLVTLALLFISFVHFTVYIKSLQNWDLICCFCLYNLQPTTFYFLSFYLLQIPPILLQSVCLLSVFWFGAFWAPCWCDLIVSGLRTVNVAMSCWSLFSFCYHICSGIDKHDNIVFGNKTCHI
jgi:hypothetical protein